MLETSQVIVLIILVATVIQFFVERIKEIVGKRVMQYVKPPIWALFFGILFAYIFKIDVFSMFGYTTQYSIVAYILTGLFLSAGAAPIHDLIKAIRSLHTAD